MFPTMLKCFRRQYVGNFEICTLNLKIKFKAVIIPEMCLTLTWTILMSNTLFVLTSMAVAVLYVALCPGESHWPLTAKVTFSQTLVFLQTASLDFSPKPCLFLDR